MAARLPLNPGLCVYFRSTKVYFVYTSNEQILADISVLKIEKCKQETVTVVHFIKLTIERVITPGRGTGMEAKKLNPQ